MEVNHKERRQALAKMVIRLFDHWKLSIADQAVMLGYSESSRSTLMRYRKGEPLADRRDLIDRVVNLLAIHSKLRVLFPKNRDLVYKWPTTPNKAFRGLTPVQFIKENGFMGLLVVKQYLDIEAVHSDKNMGSLAAAGKVRHPVRTGRVKKFDGVTIKGKSITETVIEDRK